MKALGKKSNPNSWEQVFDKHNPPRRVRGLWSRNGKLFAQLDANDGKAYRYPLHVDTVPEAITAKQAHRFRKVVGINDWSRHLIF